MAIPFSATGLKIKPDRGFGKFAKPPLNRVLTSFAFSFFPSALFEIGAVKCRRSEYKFYRCNNLNEDQAS